MDFFLRIGLTEKEGQIELLDNLLREVFNLQIKYEKLDIVEVKKLIQHTKFEIESFINNVAFGKNAIIQTLDLKLFKMLKRCRIPLEKYKTPKNVSVVKF